jgi:nucleoid-associated protein YgaU
MKLGIVTGGTIEAGAKIGNEKALTDVLPYDQARAEFRAIKHRGGDGFDIVRILTVEKVLRFEKPSQAVAVDATPITPADLSQTPATPEQPTDPTPEATPAPVPQEPKAPAKPATRRK